MSDGFPLNIRKQFPCPFDLKLGLSQTLMKSIRTSAPKLSKEIHGVSEGRVNLPQVASEGRADPLLVR
jgi:hypothetical protein